MSNEEKIKESIVLRGVCSALQSMAMPTIENLKDLLKRAGYTITITKDNK